MNPMRAAEAAPGRRFRPQLWPTVFAIVGVAILISLGNWQLRRLAWKEDLIARAEAGLAAPAEALPPEPVDYAALDFRHLEVRGHYLNDRAQGFGFTVYQQQGGGHLVTPLVLDDGRTLLVDRGWVPTAMLPPATPAAIDPEGEVTVTGVARYRGDYRPTFFQPKSSPARRRWYGWDIAAMGEAVGRPLVPIVLTAEPGPNAPPLPHAERVVIDFPNDHLGYAITWYGIAAALVGVYLALSIRKPDGPLA